MRPSRHVEGDQRSAGRQCFLKEVPEGLRLIPVARRMLLPDEGVRGHGEEGIEILGSKRPQLEEVASENRLKVEGHGWAMTL